VMNSARLHAGDAIEVHACSREPTSHPVRLSVTPQNPRVGDATVPTV
jgi:hypothetical protein